MLNIHKEEKFKDELILTLNTIKKNPFLTNSETISINKLVKKAKCVKLINKLYVTVKVTCDEEPDLFIAGTYLDLDNDTILVEQEMYDSVAERRMGIGPLVLCEEYK